MGRPVRNACKRTETALAGTLTPYPILPYLFALESIKRRSRGLLSDFNAWEPHLGDTFDYVGSNHIYLSHVKGGSRKEYG